MARPVRHKHHIIPKHAGGTDDPSNLVELTVAEHADAHHFLWCLYGRWQDKVAWQSLSGIIGKEDVVLAVQRASGGHNKGKKNPAVTAMLLNRPKNKHPSLGVKRPDTAKRNRENSGINAPMYGRRGALSPSFGMKFPERAARMSGKNAPMYGRTGDKHPMFGKTHTPDARARIGKSSSERHKGVGNPSYGKPMSEQAKIKQQLTRLRNKMIRLDNPIITQCA